MPQSARGLRTPCLLRQPPVDAFQQISQLRRRDRHRAIRAIARSSRRPDEATALQPLGEQAHALAVVPKHLDQAAAPPAEHKQLAIMSIALERLLHQQCQAVEALAHVGVAGRQPHPRSARDRNRHRRRPVRAAITAETVATSAAPLIRSRAPLASSISISPRDATIAGLAATPGSGAIVTAAKPGAARARPHSSCRHRYSWLAWIPASRATADAIAPGSSAAATIRSFSARDQRRRRSTDVITSTCVFVIGLSLGLVL